MNVTLCLPPDIEQGLLAEAESRGISLDALLEALIRQYAATGVYPFRSVPDQPAAPLKNLAQFLKESPFAGAELDLERRKDYVRPPEL